MKELKYFHVRFAFVVATILLVNCSEEKAEKEFYVDSYGYHVNVRYYKDGRLKSKITWYDSLSQTYDLIKYDSLGILTDSIAYLNGQLHGVNYTLRNDSSLTIHYSNGIRSGLSIAYVKNDTLCMGSFEDGKPYGRSLIYHANGALRSFQFYCLPGERTFEMQFDEQAQLTKVNGIPNFDDRDAIDTFSLKEKILDTISFFTPPNCKVRYQFGPVEKVKAGSITSVNIPYNRDEGREVIVLAATPERKGKVSYMLFTEILYQDSVILVDKVPIEYFVK